MLREKEREIVSKKYVEKEKDCEQEQGRITSAKRCHNYLLVIQERAKLVPVFCHGHISISFLECPTTRLYLFLQQNVP